MTMNLRPSAMVRSAAFAAVMLGSLLVTIQAQPVGRDGIVKEEFLAPNPPTPSSHASTIVETRDGLVAAWFGGTKERYPDVNIWVSRNDGRGWSAPVEEANGIQDKGGIRYPCWNPVLFSRRNGDLLLFYKVGPSPSAWWGMVKTSSNNGKTWSAPKRLPSGIVGPVRNKPIELEDGTLLCGASSEDRGWSVHMERTKNPLKGWSSTPTLGSALDYGAIQPTLLPYADGKVQILCRTKQGRIVESWSQDKGQTWTRLVPTGLPNPNSAIDAVALRDGSVLLVYNHSTNSRETMNVAVSQDGKNWEAALVLENGGGEYSYPAVIQTSDGMVHITYTWKRQKIKHVIVDPTLLKPRPIAGSLWPK